MPRRKILYKLTDYDKEQLTIIDKMLKTGCPVTFLRDFSNRRFSYWFTGSLVSFSYKKWKAYIVAPTKAVFKNPTTHEEIDVCSIYKDEAALSDALDSGDIILSKNNWLQYWIYDDKNNYITGDILENKDIPKCIYREGAKICNRLVEEWNKVPHNERAFKLSQTKWTVPYEL